MLKITSLFVKKEKKGGGLWVNNGYNVWLWLSRCPWAGGEGQGAGEGGSWGKWGWGRVGGRRRRMREGEKVNLCSMQTLPLKCILSKVARRHQELWEQLDQDWFPLKAWRVLHKASVLPICPFKHFLSYSVITEVVLLRSSLGDQRTSLNWGDNDHMSYPDNTSLNVSNGESFLSWTTTWNNSSRCA